MPQELLDDVDAWSGCIAGALHEDDFLARLTRAGFEDASVEVTNVYDGSDENNMCGAPPLPEGVQLVSGFVRATKPAPAAAPVELLLLRRARLRPRPDAPTPAAHGRIAVRPAVSGQQARSATPTHPLRCH